MTLHDHSTDQRRPGRAGLGLECNETYFVSSLPERPGLARRLVRRCLVPALIACCALPSVAVAQDSAEDDQALAQAQRLARAGQTKTALKVLRRADKAASRGCIRCVTLQAKLLLQDGQLGNAIQVAKEATERYEVDPLLAEANYMLGCGYLGRYIREVGDREDREVWAQLDQFRLLEQGSVEPPPSWILRDLERARETLELALEQRDPTAETRLQLALVIIEQQRYSESQDDWPKVMELLTAARERTSDAARQEQITALLGPAQVEAESLAVVGQGIEGPSRVNSPNPSYTELAREQGFEGSATLGVGVDTMGRVRVLEVVRPAPFGLTEAAMRSLSSWQYIPANQDGQPVAVRLTLNVRFALDGS